MDRVKRYRETVVRKSLTALQDYFSPETEESEHGKYVLASDYDALAKDHASYVIANAELATKATDAIAAVNERESLLRERDALNQYADSVKDERDALREALVTVARKLELAALPDPYDERSTSSEWLASFMRATAADIRAALSQPGEMKGEKTHE